MCSWRKKTERQRVNKGIAVLMASLSVMCVSARTVVLWPAVPDDLSGSATRVRNVAGPGDDLTLLQAKLAAPTVGWNRPANLERGVSYANAQEIVSSGMKRQAYSETAGRWLTHTNDFTVEAFVKFDGLGTTQGATIFKAFADDNSVAWEFNLQLASDGLSVYLVAAGTSLMRITDLDSVTNAWHHLALTHAFDPATQKERYRLFYDGTLVDGICEKSVPGTLVSYDYPNHQFDVLTRNNGWYISKMRMFHVRISDKVLVASELLNYGGAGTTVEAACETTVAYWKLGKGVDGNVDGSPSVGMARLNGGLAQLPGAVPADAKPTMVAVPVCAFADHPPNATVILPEGNAGSFQAVDGNSAVYCHGIGPHLAFSAAFTVEGYLKPFRPGRDASGVGHVFRNSGEGASWSLDLGKDSSGWRFHIAAADADGELGSGFFGPDLSSWSEDFKHVALVYDPQGGASGFGLWTCHLDGVVIGSVENVRMPRDSVFGPNAFTLGGGTDGFLGYYDCVRVSTTALPVGAFLCTAGGTAATDVLALWPLNRLAGEQPDGRDAAAGAHEGGGYPIHELNAQLVLSNKAGVHVVVTANDDAPTVANPDRSKSFVGDPSSTAGSAQFYAVAKDRRYLMTADRTVCDSLLDAGGYTLEGYFKRTAARVVTKEVLVGLAVTFAVSNVNAHSMQMEIANKSDGLRLVCRGQYANMKIDGYNSQEYLFDGTRDILDVGTWHHVALTATTSTDGRYDILTFELFVDGVSKGSKRARFGTEYQSGKAVAFLVGGYPTDETCFAGAASSLRISNRPLARDEFLCAKALPPVVGAVGPLGCWSLEPRGATIDAESCFPADALAPSAAGVVPSASRARTTVISPWLNGTAWPRTPNCGSAELAAAGSLSSYLLGDACNLSEPFTVEGWIKESGNDGAVRRIVGVSCSERDCGWELRLDKRGTVPRLSVFAHDGNATPIADAVFPFDATLLSADWTHLGLVYVPPSATNVKGSWTLYANGKAAGVIVNLRHPGQTNFGYAGYSVFSLGGGAGAACAGAYDIWRLSRGALTGGQLMYSARSGLVLIFK